MSLRRAIACFVLLVPCFCSIAKAQDLAVQTERFDAPSVGRTMKFNILLPASYETNTDKRYPVLYMLHGLTSSFRAWAFLGVTRAARPYDLVVVMPDAGNSWYVNWSESEEGQKNAWEDCIIKDLINHVDMHYRTISSREGRAITGLSMGGYGALMLGLRHPDMFCSIGSESGALGYAHMIAERLTAGAEPGTMRGRLTASNAANGLIGIEGFSSQAERTPKGKMFATPEQAEAHDPFALVLKVPREKLPHIYLDCGTDDRLLDGNQAFAKLLMEHKIPFTYAQSGGGHLPMYWTREVSHDIAVQYDILKRGLSRSGRRAAAAEEN